MHLLADSVETVRENGVNDCTSPLLTDQSGGENASEADQTEESDVIQSEGGNDSISQLEGGNSQDLDSSK